MRDTLKQILDDMKDKVMLNLQHVKSNETNMKKILLENDNKVRSEMLQESFGKNRKILSENLEYLELQLKIVNLLNKYGRTDFIKTPIEKILQVENTETDFFDATISGRIQFNELHPFYNDKIFITRLIEHYQSVENFEECQRLIEIQKQSPN